MNSLKDFNIKLHYLPNEHEVHFVGSLIAKHFSHVGSQVIAIQALVSKISKIGWVNLLTVKSSLVLQASFQVPVSDKRYPLFQSVQIELDVHCTQFKGQPKILSLKSYLSRLINYLNNIHFFN